ncbi:MAG TPA: S41 family peptidase [Oscillatoriaceae cyanobacterium M33_DOE_052]|uniref:S41 family peptidase n=1 Tax=Planktothricoides sp. SpSt-374 TaxID=2282167 RepID=A0A7C3VMX3_9CYAN|nr:S41 family peptidase [Oscillatoriaceae cyanobacterium M33_DOE_052]
MNQYQNHLPTSGKKTPPFASGKETQLLRVIQKALFTGALASIGHIGILLEAVNAGPPPAVGSAAQLAPTLEDSPKAIVDEVWQIVNRDYVDGDFNKVDWQAVRTDLLSRDYSSPAAAYAAVREALSKLDDPYTRFLDPEQYQTLTSKTAGELSGVGIKLGVNENQRLVVVEPIENSPAAAAQLEAGDEIVAIDDRLTTGMKVEEASKLIRGPLGTSVKLRISRMGQEEFDVNLTRARIEVAAVHYSLKEEGATKVGYIQLDEFSSHAPEQMLRAIGDLSAKGAQAFVLDLRGNPGGLLYASVEIAKMWLDGGTIVSTVDRQGDSIEFKAEPQPGIAFAPPVFKMPLAVLVDGNSASASEILAGALKDNARATIIGTQTFGKALVQSVHGLSDGSGLAVTIAHYYTPNGTDISHKGITPDITINPNSALTPQTVATKDDPWYVTAINNLRAQITPAPLANTDN